MANPDEDLSLTIFKKPKYRLMNTPSLPLSSGWFEIRLFYVRVSPCADETVPDHLTVRHLRREIGVSMEINGVRIPATETVSLTLRRDRLDKESSEVTYVSTDCVKVTGSVEFEVCEDETMMICGSLEIMDSAWSSNNNNGDDDDDDVDDLKTGWSMDCYTSASITNGGSAFVQPKIGISAPSFEVYIAGCCSGVPVILTKMIQISPRRKPTRHLTLDCIPEEVEIGKTQEQRQNGLVQRKLQITEVDVENYESNGKLANSSCYYTEEMYMGEDGQLSWFNAGVRVGVGIGLGMCLGLGIGVGVLMRSYQATTRNLRRKFF
ncbi:uncharacterized protein At1g01500-like [Impatiens glandulifera]|uniref:uncharacterized protein At1g01500-like n=1 Tax=Impatiens glandulifera TaxID=253017 RepID=UPI001FB0ADBA|nr:uncharacterized protein At1g01500-like [Impatiens glandulifera]